MEAPSVFQNLEWQVARVRRATELHDAREEDDPGKGKELLDVAIGSLDNAVGNWKDAQEHASGY